MENIKVKSLGPIKEANINFGDLTLFVGPQASGKSILLQLIKLLVDKKSIRRTIEQYGFIWGNQEEEILDRYFGEGMGSIWTKDTEVVFDHKNYKADYLKPKQKETYKTAEDELFYIPAQRIICLQNGWPRYFTEYEDAVPYVLRDFSETLRQFLESGLGKEEAVFPKNQRLKQPVRNSINDSIFHNGKIIIDKTNKKRFKLNIGGSSLPFMVWSAGQKEFMPLLLSFYYLCPGSKASRKEGIKYVIMEEPEMGLHPEAIQSVLLQVIDLLSRDYQVIISTHSPVLLEFAWAFNILKEAKATGKELSALFNLPNATSLKEMLGQQLHSKTINTYYFDRKDGQVSVRDISSLDASSEEEAVAEWGGLSSFSAKATEIVSNIAASHV